MQFVCVFFYICRKFEFLISRHKGFFSTKKRWANILIAEQLSTRSYNAKHKLCTTERSSNGENQEKVCCGPDENQRRIYRREETLRLTHSLTHCSDRTTVHLVIFSVFSAVQGPMVWNSLPDDLRAQQDFESFRQHLKTWLFSSY